VTTNSAFRKLVQPKQSTLVKNFLKPNHLGQVSKSPISGISIILMKITARMFMNFKSLVLKGNEVCNSLRTIQQVSESYSTQLKSQWVKRAGTDFRGLFYKLVVRLNELTKWWKMLPLLVMLLIQKLFSDWFEAEQLQIGRNKNWNGIVGSFPRSLT